MAGGTGVTQPSLGGATSAYQPHQGSNVFQTAANQYNSAVNTSNNTRSDTGTARVSNPNMVNAQTLAGMDLNPYMNPFQQHVTDATISDNDRARQMAMMQQGAAASAAGAFGGSRHGVADGVMQGEFDRNSLSALANLNFANFGNAQQMGQFDISSDLAAQSSNQQAQLEARRIAVAQAQARAAQTAARAQMVNAQANSANLGFGMGMTLNDAMMQAGGMQQGFQQQYLDQGMGQYGGWSSSPAGSTQVVNQAVGSIPGGGGSTESYNPGLFDYLTAGATLAGACWVAREVYGPENPAWLEFREWLMESAPAWFRKAYLKHGPKWAEWVKRNPWSKRILRPLMDAARKSRKGVAYV